MRLHRFCAFAGLGLWLASANLGVIRSWGADWPQFLGPNRDGVSTESVATNWPAEGPRVRWSHRVGAGFSGPVVIGGRVLLHTRERNQSAIACFAADRAADTEEPRWTHAYQTDYRDRFGFDPGPRGTPCVADGRVFAFGAEGTLTALDFATGRRLWQVPTATVFGADPGFFGFACSPLVVGSVVIVNVGGHDGAGIVAFDVETGKTRWKATDHEAGYASPIAARIGAELQVLSFTRQGLVVLAPDTGKIQADFGWRSRQQASVNAATPLLLGSRVLLSASYDTGAVLLDLEARPPRPVWSGDDRISSHYASLVSRDGWVFGFHGRQESGASLRCLEVATGKVLWSHDGLGSGSLLLAKDRLLVLTERGELFVAPADANGFRPLARAQVLGSGTRAFPALSDGFLYARDKDKLVCLDLRTTP